MQNMRIILVFCVQLPIEPNIHENYEIGVGEKVWKSSCPSVRGFQVVDNNRMLVEI